MLENNNVWRIKEARSNSKQHCDKIHQGLMALDNTSASRAIWELVQNARDLAQVNVDTKKKECEIAITLTPQELIFAHKGKPFTFDSLNSLVKQVSSEEKEDENEDNAGQFGTGFITTHSFGRRILVDASMSMEDLGSNEFVDIDSFEIDRTYDSMPQFIEKMANQINSIFDFANKERTTVCRAWTKLRYQLDSAGGALQKATEGISAAINVMPYVMTINDRITHVELHDMVNNKDIVYDKSPMEDENGLKVMGIHITKNGKTNVKKVYYLQSTDGKDIVILPLKDSTHAESLDGIAKLFLYFPLLGTENFGMDCIFHSQRFYPEEKRNGIVLPKDNDNVKNQYESNTKVLGELSDMYFTYMSENSGQINNLADVTKLCFNIQTEHRETNDFMTIFKKSWADHLSLYDMIDSTDGKCSLASGKVKVYDSTILTMLENDTTSDKVVYDYAKDAANIPLCEQIVKWSLVVDSWSLSEKNHLLSLADIAGSIKEQKDRAKHHDFLQFIKGGGQYQIFKDYKLLPNREGVLYSSVNLRDAKDIPANLYAVVKELVPDATTMFVDVDFADIEQLSTFDRKSLRNSLTSRLDVLDKTYLDQNLVYPDDIIKPLLRLCSFFRSEESKSVRRTTMPILAEYLGTSYTPQVLAPLSFDEPDLTEKSFKHLVQSCMLGISMKNTEWVKNNLQLLHRILDALHLWTTFCDSSNKNGFVYRYGVYPNQNYELNKAVDLRRNKDIDDELIALTERALDRNLQSEFVFPDFNDLFDFEELSSKEVGMEIEKAHADNLIPEDVIIDIIDHLDRGIWGDILPNIDKNKAEIFFRQVNKEKKDSVYRIMKVNDPSLLEEFAKIADNPNAADIIAQVKNEINRQKLEKAEYEFKYAIGKHIENVIRDKVGNELNSRLSVEVYDNQYGQDLIVAASNGKEYYVEVKSKWNFNEPAHMSSYQMKKAIAHPSNYTLCCVDMTDTGVSEYDELSIDEILDKTYAHTDIGKELATLMQGITETDIKDVETTIQMEGSYRCNIPKRVFVSGRPFDDMIMEIIKAVSD